jgi:hypothetical protein
MAKEEWVLCGINLCGTGKIQKDKCHRADDFFKDRWIGTRAPAGEYFLDTITMDDNDTRSTRDEIQQDACLTKPSADPFTSEVPTGMTLEEIVALTDELAHLNELVMLHLEKAGGFTCQASYFTIVTPILDMLEVEIRFRYRTGMSKDQMKLIVQDWIDQEIAEFKGRDPVGASGEVPEDHQ